MKQKSYDVIQTQNPIYSNIELTNAIPSRALSKGETDLIVAIRDVIQETVKNNSSSSPTKFRLYFTDMAKKKGVLPKTFKRQMEKVVSQIANNIPTETINYVSAEGDDRSLVLAMITHADINKTNGYVDIMVNPEYQRYYINSIMANPDLQLEEKFYLACNCKYSYPLSNWIVGQIALQRKDGNFNRRYDLIVPYEKLRERVPSSSKAGANDYKIKVLQTAIDDINSNVYSQIKILNRDGLVYSKGAHNSIEQFIFKVEIAPSQEEPIFTHHKTEVAIDDRNTPPWSYIRERLNKFGVWENMIAKWERYPRQAWKAYLDTISRRMTPQYMTTLYGKNYNTISVKSLAIRVAVAAPEYVDDVIATIVAGKNEEELNLFQPGETAQEEQNHILREILRQNPDFLKNDPELRRHLGIDKEQP